MIFLLGSIVVIIAIVAFKRWQQKQYARLLLSNFRILLDKNELSQDEFAEIQKRLNIS